MIQAGEILLVREAHTEARGLWSFPLGHIEAGESAENGAMREAKEESGYDIILGGSKSIVINGKDFKSSHDFTDDIITLTIFQGTTCGGALKAGNDMLDARWFPLEELNQLPLRGDWLKEFIPRR